MGIAAVLTAALGAADLGRQQTASATVAVPAARLGNPLARAQREHAARRSQVMQASRSHTRTGVRSRHQIRRAVEREAALRTRSLDRLDKAAEARSDEIRREIERRLARQRRLERQRQRELAAQRRAERMNRWVVPVSPYDITATFGAGGGLWSSSHTGLDFAAAEGSPVGSTAAGEVTSTGYDGAYGNKVVVTHDDGTQTWYCHLSSISVWAGQSVGPGTTVGTVGSTGNSTGPHLHLEVRPGGGDPVDPYSYLQARGAL